ncbi:MAG TPA: hypothetical protein VH482_12560 [Thermomicrobiales bacterium]|jgi:hypothetical protein
MVQQASARPVIDEDFREQLRNDPKVIHYQRQITEPFEPAFFLTGPLDVNWLMGRREDDEVAPRLRGIDD